MTLITLRNSGLFNQHNNLKQLNERNNLKQLNEHNDPKQLNQHDEPNNPELNEHSDPNNPNETKEINAHDNFEQKIFFREMFLNKKIVATAVL